MGWLQDAWSTVAGGGKEKAPPKTFGDLLSQDAINQLTTTNDSSIMVVEDNKTVKQTNNQTIKQTNKLTDGFSTRVQDAFSTTSTPVDSNEDVVDVNNEQVKRVKDSFVSAGFKDNQEIANILGMIQAESNFRPRAESGKYTPERAAAIFPKYFKDAAEARQILSQGEEAFFNRVYGGRMGNAANEGFKYRGRGYIQLTGKDNYAKYGKMIGEDLVANPDKANDPDVALKIAIAYMKDRKGKLDYRTVEGVSQAIGHVRTPEENQRRAALSAAFLKQIQGQ